MSTFTIKLSATLSGDNLPPKGYPALNMNDGTKSLFDFTDASCSPQPVGLLENGSAFLDLAGGAGAAVAGALTQRVSKTAKGLRWPGTAGSALLTSQRVDFGSSRRLDFGARFAIGLWITREAGTIESNYQRILGRGPTESSNANSSTLLMDTGASGSSYDARATVLPAGAAAGVGNHVPSGLIPTGTPHLYVIEFEPAVAMRLYRDNAVALAPVPIGQAALQVSDTDFLTASMWIGGTLHGLVMEQLSISGRTGAQFAAAEWAARRSRFV